MKIDKFFVMPKQKEFIFSVEKTEKKLPFKFHE